MKWAAIGAAMLAVCAVLYSPTVALLFIAAVGAFALRRRLGARRWQAPVPEPAGNETVYLVRAECGLTKIGWSRSETAKARFTTLQEQSPEPLWLLGEGRGSFELEQWLHDQFREFQVYPSHLPAPTEWFALDDAQTEWIRRGLRRSSFPATRAT